MLGISAIALKIVLKNGKDLRRELIGVRIQPISQKQSNLWSQACLFKNFSSTVLEEIPRNAQ